MFSAVLYAASEKYAAMSKLVSVRFVDDADFGRQALMSDLSIFSVATASYVIAIIIRNYTLGVLFRIISLFLIILWMADAFILRTFTVRLLFSDVIKFAKEGDAIRQFLFESFSENGFLYGILGLIILGVVLFLFTDTKPYAKRVHAVFLSIPIVLWGFFLYGNSFNFVHSWTYRNVISLNLEQGISKKYSEAYIANLNRQEDDLGNRTACKSGLGKKENVIIVIFESLSMYHGDAFSDADKFTPHFNRIARENTLFTNFFSNGFTTEAGLISLFTGKHLLPPVMNYSAATFGFGFNFLGYDDRQGSLPEVFNANNYSTAFLMTGDLRFLFKGDWLKNIGFQITEGARSSFYDKWPRGMFNAAPDRALYLRAFHALPWLRKKGPYLLVLETTSTHQPFVNPENLERSEVGAFNYADKALGEFYDHLKRKDYFDDGILVIVSDHRSMTALQEKEVEVYGKTAAARVPMVIAYGKEAAPKVVTSYTQQTDFIPSFEYLVGKKACTGPLSGNFFEEPIEEAQYIMFPRGDNRDYVDVYTPKGNAAIIEIRGDETALIEGNVPEVEKIISHIGKERQRVEQSAKK